MQWTTRMWAGVLVILAFGILSCGRKEPLDPQVRQCLDAIGELAYSRHLQVEREGRLCKARLPDECTASREAAEGDRVACEDIDLHAGFGNEAIGAELRISCPVRFLFIKLDDEKSSIRVWGYVDKKFPRVVNEAVPALRDPSTLPSCTAAFYSPGSSDGPEWVARELTFFPGTDGNGRPLVTERASWEFQLRQIEWEQRRSERREYEEFLDEVFPIEFERAIRSDDAGARDWVRFDVPGVQRLTYEKIAD